LKGRNNAHRPTRIQLRRIVNSGLRRDNWLVLSDSCAGLMLKHRLLDRTRTITFC
jgi:hypothetical protein